MDVFFNSDPKPNGSLGEFDEERWEWIEKFQVVEEPPLRFGILLGDVVHNLRSALDHLVCQLTLLDTDGHGKTDQVQFPIASQSDAQFERMADRRIPGLIPEHRALVKSAQPFHRGDRARHHSLSVLAELSNADKHRVIHTTYNAMDTDAGAALDRLIGAYGGDGPSPVTHWFLVTRGTRLKQDTVWFRAAFDRFAIRGPVEMKVQGNLSLGISFGEIGLAASDFRKIAEDIWRIIERFLHEFPETRYLD